MDIVPSRDILRENGLEEPDLNSLIPSQDNYSSMLFQPKGNLEVGDSGVRHVDRVLANAQFSQFLQKASDEEIELVVTPEYSMPWDTLEQQLAGGVSPSEGGLWVLGCEGIKLAALQEMSARLSPDVRMLHEDLVDDPNRFVNAIAYVFWTRFADVDQNQLVVLLQFKVCPLGDPNHFEVNGMIKGSRLYTFGGNGRLRIATIICSDAFAFNDAHANEIYDRTLLIHIQLNPKPRQDQFKLYRAKLLSFGGGQTELICLNWAQGVKFSTPDGIVEWKNIGGSCWYLSPDKFDKRDATLAENHKRGMYYTWIDSLRCHGMFLNYDETLFCISASKVAHIGVQASVSRRRGPQLEKSLTWNDDESSWQSQDSIDTGFDASTHECGDAESCLCEIANSNPLNAERVLALTVGSIESGPNWHALNELDSCCVDASEVVRRMTVCQDPDGKQFRSQRLRMLGRLYAILNNALPPSIADLANGFGIDWSSSSPHQNVTSHNGKRATAIYLSDSRNADEAFAIEQKTSDYLGQTFAEPDQIVDARQRLHVWYRDPEGNDVSVNPQPCVDFGETRTDSPFDIAREG